MGIGAITLRPILKQEHKVKFQTKNIIHIEHQGVTIIRLTDIFKEQ